jgi:hypothetical protein
MPFVIDLALAGAFSSAIISQAPSVLPAPASERRRTTTDHRASRRRIFVFQRLRVYDLPRSEARLRLPAPWEWKPPTRVVPPSQAPSVFRRLRESVSRAVSFTSHPRRRLSVFWRLRGPRPRATRRLAGAFPSLRELIGYRRGLWLLRTGGLPMLAGAFSSSGACEVQRRKSLWRRVLCSLMRVPRKMRLPKPHDFRRTGV